MNTTAPFFMLADQERIYAGDPFAQQLDGWCIFRQNSLLFACKLVLGFLAHQNHTSLV